MMLIGPSAVEGEPSEPVGGPGGDREVDAAVHARVVADGGGHLAPGRLEGLVRELAPLLPAHRVEGVATRVRARATGLGPLEPILADPAVSEVMINGPGAVWVERAGRLVRTPVELDASTVDHLAARILGPLGLRADRSSPMADARLPDGSRVHVVVSPLAVDGTCLTIRRFSTRTVDLDRFAGPPVVRLLRWAVTARQQILVSGGASAGKTTLLNALGAHIEATERVVTVEDAAELNLPGDHVVRLEARPASAEGTGAVSIRDLVRAALRMRPDRLIVGEVRGQEALDMLQAMNTGHDGSLSTCHANGPDDALRRLETMVLTGGELPLAAVREQIASAVDLVVQVARRSDGTRRITAVAEVEPDPTLAARTTTVADGDTVVSLPRRPARDTAATPPDERWLGRTPTEGSW